MAVPNWGPMAGQEVANPDEYVRQSPPPPGGSFSASAAQAQGSSGATLGPLETDPNELQNAAKYIAFESPVKKNLTEPNPWDAYFAQGAAAGSIQMPGFNTSNSDQARAQQNQVIQDLQGQAAGSLDTGAQRQLRQGYQQAGAQQSSIGSSIRGQSAGAAMRGIQSGQAGIQRGFSGDQQMLKLQEQQAAQAMLAQLLAQQHGQDIGQAQSMAQGQLQGDALNQAMRQFYLGGAIDRGVGNSQYASDFLRSQLGMDLENRDLDRQNANRWLGAGSAAAGTAMSALNLGGSGSSDSRYRQVDGQDSIVPVEDK